MTRTITMTAAILLAVAAAFAAAGAEAAFSPVKYNATGETSFEVEVWGRTYRYEKNKNHEIHEKHEMVRGGVSCISCISWLKRKRDADDCSQITIDTEDKR